MSTYNQLMKTFLIYTFIVGITTDITNENK